MVGRTSPSSAAATSSAPSASCPYTRGRERGAPPREILRQARALAAAGYKEVQLLGQTVNSYRHEEVGFADLLRAVAAVDGLERIRFTSPYPLDFTAEVIAAIAETPKVCKHVHLPLQSGSDSVLARMRRGYDFAELPRRWSASLRAAIPGIAITTDLLVGFCDETEDEFAGDPARAGGAALRQRLHVRLLASARGPTPPASCPTPSPTR